jgi:RNA polymerase subunit RPABC4/transcription elongation factor Spt4
VVRFRIRFGRREIDLPGGELIVGRASDCHVRIDSPSVSRHHLRLLVLGDSVIVYDLGSRNGTWVNGVRIEGPRELKDGDTVRLATQSFTIKAVSPETLRDGDEDTDTCQAYVPPKERVLRRAERANRSPFNQRQTKPVLVRSSDGTVRQFALDETVRVTGITDDEADALVTSEHTCTGCGTLLPLGVTVCPHCGTETYSTPTYRTCLGCRALVPEGARECPECGLERPITSPRLADGTDRRSDARHDVDFRALYVSSSLTVEDEVLNLSSGGMFLASELLDPIGTRADLILFKGDQGKARFVGEVVHVVSSSDRGLRSGMGIRFTKISPAAHIWLLDHVKTESTE